MAGSSCSAGKDTSRSGVAHERFPCKYRLWNAPVQVRRNSRRMIRNHCPYYDYHMEKIQWRKLLTMTSMTMKPFLLGTRFLWLGH
jgi:hypothetical protein